MWLISFYLELSSSKTDGKLDQTCTIEFGKVITFCLFCCESETNDSDSQDILLRNLNRTVSSQGRTFLCGDSGGGGSLCVCYWL